MRACGLLGIMMAVELSPAEKEFESVVAAIVLRRMGSIYRSRRWESAYILSSRAIGLNKTRSLNSERKLSFCYGND